MIQEYVRIIRGKNAHETVVNHKKVSDCLFRRGKPVFCPYKVKISDLKSNSKSRSSTYSSTKTNTHDSETPTEVNEIMREHGFHCFDEF